MADVRPFRALRPHHDLAARITAPPYDVLSEREAENLAQDALNFVHVTRSEVDLPRGTDPHSPAAYAKARENLDRLTESAMHRDAEPTFYVYGLRSGEQHQVGFLAGCSTVEYVQGQIRRHEHTRPDKELDRTNHMLALEAQVGPVFLAYRDTPELTALLHATMETPPEWRFVAEDGVEQTLWCVPPSRVDAVREAFSRVPALYIADGHHRSAAAARVHEQGRYGGSGYFLAGVYPASQLKILAYNRVIEDLNGASPEQFLAAVDARFDRSVAEVERPKARGTFTMFFGGRWFQLTPKQSLPIATDPVSRLDVSVLQDHLLGPILGIDDPRRSERIRFVGGIRGPEALEQAVRDGAAVAFHLYPTGLDQLFEVADAGDVMPPKSTWFEPKLREGVVVRMLDEPA